MTRIYITKTIEKTGKILRKFGDTIPWLKCEVKPGFKISVPKFSINSRARARTHASRACARACARVGAIILIFIFLPFLANAISTTSTATSTPTSTPPIEEPKEEPKNGGRGGGPILTEDFNACDLGNLDANAGCPGWSGVAHFQVQEATAENPEETGKEIYNTTGGGSIYKIGTQLSAGQQGCYLRLKGTHAPGDPYLMLMEGVSTRAMVLFNADVGQIQGWHSGGYLNLGAFSQETWHWVSVEWRSSPDKKVRYLVDEGEPTEWLTPGAVWATGLDRVYLNFGGPSTNDAWWDYVAEEPYAPPPPPPELETLIENASTGASFFIRKTMSYGRIIIILLLSMLLIFGVVEFLVGSIIPQKLNYFKR